MTATITAHFVRENWNKQKRRFKTKFSSLTDTGWCYAESKKGKMFDKIQIKLGKAREELKTIIPAL